MQTRDSSSDLVWGAERSDAPDTRPPPDARRAGRAEASEARPAPAGVTEGAGLGSAEPVSVGAQPDPSTATDASMPAETAAHVVIADRLKRAGEWVYSRGRPDHPVFRSARIAAANLLRLIPTDLPILVKRDQSLRALRELILEQGRRLVVPNKAGTEVYLLPRSAIYAKDGTRIPLKVDPLPRDSMPYVGPVGAVVVGCLAFDPHRRHLISFDIERTVDMLIKAYNGLQGGFKLSRKVPVIVTAADCQEAAGWRAEAFGYTQADCVITPTRLITLGTGKVSHFSGPSDGVGVSKTFTLRSGILVGGLDYVRH